MIGPHEGRELELMLAGKKHLAAFSDIVPDNGIIDEHIIPEKKFKPHIESGNLFRLSEEYTDLRGYKIRIVCYTTIKHKWRAEAYIYIRKKIHFKEIDYTDSIDQLIGHLLDYSQTDIDDFLSQ